MAAATATTAGGHTAVCFPLLLTKHTQFPVQLRSSYSFSSSSLIVSHSAISSPIPRSVSSSETALVDEEEKERITTASEDDLSPDAAGSVPPFTGCKACGRPEIERGCNGEGRMQGGIATVPGFGWWPIKAYRPCPAYVASGGRYRRSGQSMDEVVSGRSGGVSSARKRTADGARSSKKIKDQGD